MIAISVQVDMLIKNLQRSLDLSKNNTPLFRAFVGPEGSIEEFNIRGNINKHFASQTDAVDESTAWAPLKESTVKSKAKKYGGGMPLVATGTLYQSLVASNGYTVYQTTNTTLRYGTSVPYAGYHMTGTKFMDARRYIGMNYTLKAAFVAAWKQYTKDALEGRS